MKKHLLIVLLLMFSSVFLTAQEKEILTNQTIIELIDLGLTSDVINAKILSTETNFDVSIEDLKILKEKSIPSDVVRTMIQAHALGDTVKSEKTGIFYVISGEEKQVLPTVFSGTKTRTLASALTYGIASAKIKSTLNSPTADLVVSPNDLEFVFYFSPFRDNQLNATDWWFRVTSSPTEFVLVKLDVNKRKKIREIETGKANIWVGTDSGVKGANVISYEVIKIKDGKFAVKPKEQITQGEYCFFFAGRIPEGGYSNQSVFDFSVQ